MHNVINDGILPITPFEPELYFCPFKTMIAICEEVLDYDREEDDEDELGAIHLFSHQYPYVGNMPDRFDIIDPRFLHQMLWVEQNRALQSSQTNRAAQLHLQNTGQPMRMAAVPPLTSFDGVDNPLVREFKQKQCSVNDRIFFVPSASPAVSTNDAGVPSRLGPNFALTTTSSMGMIVDSPAATTVVQPSGGVYLNASTLPQLTSISPEALTTFRKKLANFFNQTGSMQDIRNLIPNPTLATTLISLLQVSSLLSVGDLIENEFFRDFHTFDRTIEKFVSQTKPSHRNALSVVKERLHLSIVNPLDTEALTATITQYHTFYQEYRDSLDNMPSQSEVLSQFIKVNSQANKPVFQRHLFTAMLSTSRLEKWTTLNQGFEFLKKYIAQNKAHLEWARDFAGWSPPSDHSNKRGAAEHLAPVAPGGGKKAKVTPSANTKPQPGTKPPSEAPRVKCRVCGNPKHTTATCTRKNNKFANSNPDIEWLHAPGGGVKLRAAYPALTEKVLKFLPNVAYLETLKAARVIESYNPKDFEGECLGSATPTCACSYEMSLSVSHSCPQCHERLLHPTVSSCGVISPSHAPVRSSIIDVTLTVYNPLPYSLQCKALIDTGALEANYASKEIGDWLLTHHVPSVSPANLVCSPINNSCTTSLGSFRVDDLVVYDDKINIELSIDIKILPITSSLYSIIIGLPDITKYSLLRTFEHRFVDDAMLVVEPYSAAPIREEGLHNATTHRSVYGNDYVPGYTSDVMELHTHDTEYDNSHWLQLIEESKVRMDGAYLANMFPHGNDMLHYENEVAITDDPYWSSMGQKKGLEVAEGYHHINVANVRGSPNFIQQSLLLCKEFEDRFSRTIRSEAAYLPPFEIEVDCAKWEVNATRGPPRMQSAEKNEFIRDFVENGLDLGMLSPAPLVEHYSQVHCVPKPTSSDGVKQWRPTLDLRFMNSCARKRSWPIPNIATMMQRIGRAKPRYFAKVDMTSGYHQTPLAEHSKRFTAFICFMGIFTYNRTPQGAQGSSGYFQCMMTTIVLAGLVYMICECYIDDILIYAQDEKTFFDRLRQVFTRLRKFNIYLHPDKIYFNDSCIEFLGHEINHLGMRFTQEKLDGIKDFPLPPDKGTLKQFLGLANYFRDNVANHSILAHPLQQMIPNYSKKVRNQKLHWLPEQITAFQKMQNAIISCQRLYFVNDDWPTFLESDASDFGIGSVIYQVDPTTNAKVPIMFISKSLTGPQLRWSVPEKEMYATYFTLVKAEHLLKDRPFTLRTDHKNLTLIRSTGSDKVYRWDLYMQEFPMTKEYLDGDSNIAADACSRLCPVEDSPERKSHFLTTIEEDYSPYEMLSSITQSPDTFLSDSLSALNDPITRLSNDTYRAISNVHNSVAGHHGVDKTLRKLIRVGNIWEHMKRDVILFIKQCPCCQKMSHIRIPIMTQPYTTASYGLNTKISMDTIGPLPMSEEGYIHLLVVIDNFSRYVELYPLRDLTALTAAKRIVEHIGRHGCPNTIQFDNGSQFCNELISEVITMIGTESIRTLAYSKEENAIVERANKEVVRHTRALVFELGKHNDWPNFLPFTQRILNSEVSSVTGVSPNALRYGDTVDLDRGIYLPLDPTSDTVTQYSPWSQRMLQMQARLLAIAEEHQRKVDAEHLKHAPTQITTYDINSFVLVSYPDGAMGPRPPTKNHTFWRGPLRVINYIGAHYVLHNLVTNEEETMHVHRLKPFEYDPAHTDPVAVARADANEYLIGAVLAHAGDPKRRTSLDFLIRWEGYDESEDLWLPWKAVRLNPKVHDYLRTHGMSRLIPK